MTIFAKKVGNSASLFKIVCSLTIIPLIITYVLIKLFKQTFKSML
jgi:hypothetical protein